MGSFMSTTPPLFPLWSHPFITSTATPNAQRQQQQRTTASCHASLLIFVAATRQAGVLGLSLALYLSPLPTCFSAESQQPAI